MILKKAGAVILTIALMCSGNTFNAANEKNVVGSKASEKVTLTNSSVENLSEMERSEADSWFSLEGITPLQAGETATVKLTVNKTMHMNSWFIDIVIDDEKLEFVQEKDEEGDYVFHLYENLKGLKAGNYLENGKEVKLAGAYTETGTEGAIPEGTVFFSFKIKAKVDLTDGDVIATLTNVSFTDEVQGLDETLTNGKECVVKDYVLGDVDGSGSPTVLDALLVLRHVTSHILEGDEKALKAADMNGDGEVTVIDALYILRKVASGS